MKKYRKQSVIIYCGRRIPHMSADKKNNENRSRCLTNIFYFLFLSFSFSVLLVVANERKANATFLFV